MNAGSRLVLVVVPAGEADAAAVAGVVEDLGFRAQVHHDAGSALEAVEYDHPAIVVHGWDLPDMDAVTFHGAVQKRAGGRTLPTLAIAPDAGAASRLSPGATDGSDWIVRPFRREALETRLEEIAARAGIARPARKPTGRDEPARVIEKERTMDRTERQSRPEGVPGLRLSVIGLGDWGVRGAELFDRVGVQARGIDVSAAVDRSGLPDGRRHRVAATGDHAAASRAMAADQAVGEALRADSDSDLFVVLANLGVGAGSLAAALLARIADIAPRAGRHVVARLPGVRSGPEERALALVALNAVLQGPASGIFLVQPPDASAATDADADPSAPLFRLLDLWQLAAGAGAEPIQGLSGPALARVLATPGFVGWRETTLTADEIAPDGRGWHELVVAAPWQAQGFAWGDAQAVLPLAKLPWAWLEGGGRRQFERFLQAAWDEAAPCALVPALYAGDPASAVLVSAGMPYPRGVLTLRDSVEADRARLAEKRRKAEAPIPLSDDFLPRGLDVLAAVVGSFTSAPAAEPRIERPAPAPEPWIKRPAPAPEPWIERPAPAPEPPRREPEPTYREPEPIRREPAPEPRFEVPVPEPADEPIWEHDLPRRPEPAPATPVIDTRPEPAIEMTPLVEPRPPVIEPPAREAAEPEIEWMPEPTWEAGPPPPAAAEPATPVVEIDPISIWEPETVVHAEPEPPVTREPQVRERLPWEPEPAVETPVAAVEFPELEAAPMPPAYESALGLVRRIFSARDLRAEVDLGEVRYALYDLLEVLREEPQAILPEVFRPATDEYFERHHVNVAVLAILTGDLLKGSLSEVIDLGTAALLHDIGMLATRETWDVGVKLPPKVFDRAIRPHPDMGFRRLQEITGMTGPIARMVLEEHERMDGTGYPEGLAGEAIDPGARILAVCDTLEALAHPRPYRDHLSPGEAIARLQILGQYTLDQSVVQALAGELTELLRRGAPESNRR